MPALDLTGQRFGKLTVIEPTHQRGRPVWRCKCDCGRMVVRSGHRLRSKADSCVQMWREQWKHTGSLYNAGDELAMEADIRTAMACAFGETNDLDGWLREVA